jgi:CheY-like chemotaxis protein
MPKNLLLADDSKTIQQAVSMTFAGEDVKLTTVGDGEAALQAAKQSKPDLILADVGMPKLGGYELCQRVRADAALKDVPVLLLGGGIPVDPAKAIAVGANGHMPKPFDSGKLIEQVKTILANPKAKPVIATGPTTIPPKPAAPVARPSMPNPSKPAVSPGGSVGAGSTMVMARPPVPAAPASRPPAPVPPRPSAPPPARPAASAPPPVARPAAPASRPPAPATTPPPVAARPPAPQASKPAPPARPAAPPLKKPTPPPPPAALDDDEDIPMDDEIVDAEEAAGPAPTPLRPVPSPAHKPALSVVPPPGDGGEAVLREALSRASREVIEKIAWEVVPELAETIIREELERLIKERGA